MGSNANLFMGLSSTVQGAGSVATAATSAASAIAQGEYQKQQLETNARFAELQANDAKRRGEKAVSQLRRTTRQMLGAQRAAYAGQGVEVDSGTPLEIQEETRFLAAEDELTIRTNAWREAWGYKVEATNLRGQAGLVRRAAQNEAATTLLTGGVRALSSGLESAYYFGGGGRKR